MAGASMIALRAMNPTAIEILRAAMEEIARDSIDLAWQKDFARAALEAAAKAPGIADNNEMHAVALAAIQRCVNIGPNSRETVADAVLVAVDEWMRGGK